MVWEPWPANPPDLNLIKILPDKSKDKLTAKYPKLQGTKELTSQVLEEWDQIPQEKSNSIIESMPWKIEAYIHDNEGNNFNFYFYFFNSIVLLYFLSLRCYFQTLLRSSLFDGARGY